MNLGDKIINLRKKENLTQENLAEILHVSRQSVSNWETGKSYPDIATLILISDKFKISLDDLLKDKKMIKVLDKMNKRNKLNTVIIFILIIIIFVIGLFIAKKYTPNYENNPIFYNDIKIEDIMRSEDGLIMSIRKFNANCLNALIEIYNDGTYKLYDTNIIPDSEVINAILIWDDPKTFTFKYNALDILKDMKKINKGEYEIQLGSGEVYTTDSSNKALMAFLNNEDIDLNKCGKTIKREIENGLYKLANNIYSSEINPKFVHEGEVISVANFLSSSYCTYECIFNHEKPIEVKNNIRIYSYDVLESKYYLVECGNIYIGKDKNALINYCQKS